MGERIEAAWAARVKTGDAWATHWRTETAWTVGVRTWDALLTHWRGAWAVVRRMTGTAKLMAEAAKLMHWRAAWAANVKMTGRRDQTGAGTVTGTPPVTAVVAGRQRQYAVAGRQYDLAGRQRQYGGMRSAVLSLRGGSDIGESCHPSAERATGAATRDSGRQLMTARGGEMVTRAMAAAAVIRARCAVRAEEERT